MTKIYEYAQEMVEERLFNVDIPQKSLDRLVNYVVNIVNASNINIESDAAMIVVNGICNAYYEGEVVGITSSLEFE